MVLETMMKMITAAFKAPSLSASSYSRTQSLMSFLLCISTGHLSNLLRNFSMSQLSALSKAPSLSPSSYYRTRSSLMSFILRISTGRFKPLSNFSMTQLSISLTL
jgi:hypothetical protein